MAHTPYQVAEQVSTGHSVEQKREKEQWKMIRVSDIDTDGRSTQVAVQLCVCFFSND